MSLRHTRRSSRMDEYESLSHSKWACKYHVVFIPKCRRKTLYASLRPHLGEVFRRLAEQKQSRVEEGHRSRSSANSCWNARLSRNLTKLLSCATVSGLVNPSSIARRRYFIARSVIPAFAKLWAL